MRSHVIQAQPGWNVLVPNYDLSEAEGIKITHFMSFPVVAWGLRLSEDGIGAPVPITCEGAYTEPLWLLEAPDGAVGIPGGDWWGDREDALVAFETADDDGAES